LILPLQAYFSGLDIDPEEAHENGTPSKSLVFIPSTLVVHFPASYVSFREGHVEYLLMATR